MGGAVLGERRHDDDFEGVKVGLESRSCSAEYSLKEVVVVLISENGLG